MSKTFALFAGGMVGLDIANFLTESNADLACLVIDSKDASDIPDKVIRASSVAPGLVLKSADVYTEENINFLRSLKIDIFVLAWWPYILKQSLIDIPTIGTLNFHPSYLPYNRGKHYNFWNIVEEVPFGVTIHFIDKGVDTGDIAFQTLIAKTWEDTGESLYYKAQHAIVQLFKDNYSSIETGQIPHHPQSLSEGSFHKADELETASRIHLDKTYTGRQILNILRARTFPPHPSAWFIDQGQRHEVRIRINKLGSVSEG